MKTAGIIGGVGPESTIEYYRGIIASYRVKKEDGSYPSIFINSINLQRVVDLVTSNDPGSLTEYLLSEIERLSKAGADFGALAANTPHIVFDELRARSPIPLISIVECACDAVRDLGLTRVALFGTRFTMQGQFYPKVFSRAGITLVIPEQHEQDFIHQKYMGELLKNVFLPETRDGLLAIADQLKARSGIEAIILGGTELPLILNDTQHNGIPLLDTTQIHVERIVGQLLA